MAFAWKSHTVIWRQLGEFLIGVLVIRALARVSPYGPVSKLLFGVARRSPQ